MQMRRNAITFGHSLLKQALGAAARLSRGRLVRRPLAAFETRLLSTMMKRTVDSGPDGRALGYLFQRHESGRSPRDIYDEVFSRQRFEHGYRSQMGQDLFLNRWF